MINRFKSDLLLKSRKTRGAMSSQLSATNRSSLNQATRLPPYGFKICNKLMANQIMEIKIWSFL